MEALIQLGVVVVLLVVGLGAGRVAERRHLTRIQQRESANQGIIMITDLRSFPGGVQTSVTPVLVSGEAVISSDYFKTFLASLRKIIGGELRSLESLMNRARREAILRMVEQAKAVGCDTVCNVRIEGFDIAGSNQKSKKAMVLVTVLATGTAYKRNAA